MEERIIASFKSRSQMMSFDTALRRGGVETDIIPTPKAIALGCGLSVEFPAERINTAKAIIKALNPSTFEGFYTIAGEGKRVKVQKIFE